MKTTIKKLILASTALAFALGAAYANSVADNWENSCASCHGTDGKAQTKLGKRLKIRDYTDPKVQAELKDDAMLIAILDGVKEGGKERMQGYRDEYSEQEAKDLVTFIRQLKP